MSDNYSGIQKAAILLITLGPEKASSIFQHLKEDEIESLTLEIANTRSVSVGILFMTLIASYRPTIILSNDE